MRIITKFVLCGTALAMTPLLAHAGVDMYLKVNNAPSCARAGGTFVNHGGSMVCTAGSRTTNAPAYQAGPAEGAAAADEVRIRGQYNNANDARTACVAAHGTFSNTAGRLQCANPTTPVAGVTVTGTRIPRNLTTISPTGTPTSTATTPPR
jgi:hypothetical protein